MLEAKLMEETTKYNGRSVKELDLLRPLYQATAAYGHFGRTEETINWEKTTKAQQLKYL